MPGSGSHRIAWLCACLASGPLYLLAAAFASAIEAIPQPIVTDWQSVFQFALVMIPAVLVGFLASAIPLAFAIALLSFLANDAPMLRAPVAWTLAGGIAAGLILFATGADDFTTRCALICTGMVSMRLARSYLHWPSDCSEAAVLGSRARSL